jgi:glutaminyl-peptide cyclotransferase
VFKRGSQVPVGYLEKNEMDALLDAPDNATWIGSRDRALLLFLYNSGARASEAARLVVGDLRLHSSEIAQPFVELHGKGNKIRLCPLWASTVRELTQLTRGQADDQRVFLSRYRKLVARIPGSSPSVTILAGHYDTKRMTIPFVGANDGASSAAFLLEMARVLGRRRNGLTYWLVFFDGEEALQRWSPADGLYGSRHFAQELSAEGILQQVRAAILVDMIADAHLNIRRETHSTPWLTDIVFAQAQHLGYARYFLNSPRVIEDDHVSFLELGIPAVDIIDLDYGPFNLYWHTRCDTVDKCSPASVAIVARVIFGTLTVLESSSSS